MNESLTQPRTVRVTAEHIEKGKPRTCSLCLVALAILDAFPEASGTMVTRYGFDVSIGPFFRGANTPSTVSEVIDRFDSGLPVEPFEFQVAGPATGMGSLGHPGAAADGVFREQGAG